jgi:trehalose 6-phosphate synthase
MMQDYESEDLEQVSEAQPYWTRDTLREVVERVLARSHFIVVSNREPYIHRFDGEEILCERPVSGLVTALEPVMRVCGGTWIAHGSGNADRESVDANDRLAVPPRKPEYTLRRVWLTKEDEDDYYYGMANQAIWPLCHIVYQRPLFDLHDWEAYGRVNRQFATAVLDEARGHQAIVLIQDYHFALLPRLLRNADPNLLIAQFWHIPWPNREAFRICPWGPELLDGLLGNDLLGFHLRYHGQNFLESVADTIEARVDRDRFSILRGGQTTRVRPFPISVDLDALSEQAVAPETQARVARLRQQLGLTGQRVLLGIDRLDYTKGIPERLRAFDRLLGSHPELLGKVRFVQIGAPTRTRIASYKDLAREIEELVVEINWRYAQGPWTPIVYSDVPVGPDDVTAYYQLADVCIASSLHDGMNLVAKEYVGARPDGDGVLVLSRFTGAARELEQSLTVNPFAVDEMASVLHQALSMEEPERRARMAALRGTVARNNIYRWAGKIVDELGRIAMLRRLEVAE